VFSCDEFLAELGNYADGEVTAELRRQLELHLSACRTCQVIYDSMSKTLRIVTESGSFDLPESLSEAMVTNIMRQIRRRASSPPPSPASGGSPT
jgi:anti-sigma factor RsiW